MIREERATLAGHSWPGWAALNRLKTRRGRGLLLVLLAAASFGAVTPFARLAYDDGVNVTTIMAVRYTLATVAVLGYLAWSRQPWRVGGRRLWQTVGLALFLGLLSFAYLGSVQYIPTSLAALIYYTYPLLVTLLGHVTGVERLDKGDRLTRLLTAGGQVISLGGLALLLGLSWSSLNGVGLLLAAAAAASFALALFFGDRLMQAVPPMSLNLVVATVNAALFTGAALLGAGFAWPALTTGWVGLIGVAVFFVLGFLGLFAGVTLVGAGRAACLTNIEPVVTVILAITLLGEPFSLWQFVGVGAVLTGIFLVCRQLLAEHALSAEERQKIREVMRKLYCTPDCLADSRCFL